MILSRRKICAYGWRCLIRDSNSCGKKRRRYHIILRLILERYESGFVNFSRSLATVKAAPPNVENSAQEHLLKSLLFYITRKRVL